jgi:hypothetical protein
VAVDDVGQAAEIGESHMEQPNQATDGDEEREQASESDKSSRNRPPLFEIDIVAFGHKIQFVPNVHSVLAFSAIFVAAALIYSEVISHGEATPLLFAEVAHFAGWVYLELPETLVIEAIEKEEEAERYGI